MNLKTILAVLAFTLTLYSFGQDDPVIDSLMNVLRNGKEDTGKVNTMIALSKKYQGFSDYGLVHHWADSAFLLAEKLNFTRGMAEANTQNAKAFHGQSNYPDALKFNEAALDLWQALEIQEGIGNSLYNLGTVYRAQGKLLRALQYFTESLKIMQESGNRDGIANAYYQIGLAYFIMTDCTQSMANLMLAMDLYEQSGNRKGIADTYNMMGNLYKDQREFDKAMKDFQISLKIREEIGDKRGMAVSYSNIGIVYFDNRNLDKALKYYMKAVEIFEEIGDRALSAKMYSHIAKIYYLRNDFSESSRYYQNALLICEEIGNYTMLGWIKNNMGLLNIATRNYPEARRYLEEGIQQARQSNIKSDIQGGYLFMAKLDSIEGDYKLAYEHYKLHALYKDSVFNEDRKNRLTQLDVQFETERKDHEIELLNKDNEIKSLQLKQQKMARNSVMIGMALLVLFGLMLFRSLQLRKKLEKQKAIAQERKRISADLHDDVGSGLSRIALLSEMVKNAAKSPEARQEAEKISSVSQELSSNISEIIWALNANNDFLENLVAYIRRYAAEFFENRTEKLKITTPSDLDQIPISGEQRRNIFFAVKEALNNIVKHAGASEAELKFEVRDHLLSIEIKDNGKGFQQGELNRFGNGILNMQNRMRSINGECSFENHQGTKITLTLPV